MGGSCAVGIWEFVGRPMSMPPNGALYLLEPYPCGAPPGPIGPVSPRWGGPSRVITGGTVEHYPATGADLQAVCTNIFDTTGPVDPHDNTRHAGSTELGWAPYWSAPNPAVDGMIAVHIDSVVSSSYSC